jgi:hypothetical protein
MAQTAAATTLAHCSVANSPNNSVPKDNCLSPANKHRRGIRRDGKPPDTPEGPAGVLQVGTHTHALVKAINLKQQEDALPVGTNATCGCIWWHVQIMECLLGTGHRQAQVSWCPTGR